MTRPALRTPLFTTPPLSIRDLPADSKHHIKGRQGFQPMVIILHHTGGLWSGPWLSTTSKPPVSTHRLIAKPGIIYKIVRDEDTAYTAGFGVIGAIDPDTNDPPDTPSNLNPASLHIELENLGNGRDPFPAPQMDACAAQIVEWWGKYGHLGILAHREVDSRKEDPADNFDWEDLFRRIDARYLAVRRGVV